MEQVEYETAFRRSRGLFNHALILPVAAIVASHVGDGGDLTVSDVRIWLGGRAADNRITEALRRIEATEALVELPYPGRPHPHRWVRKEHPLWRFVGEWAEVPVER